MKPIPYILFSLHLVLCSYTQSPESFTFDYCEAESHLCQEKCRVELKEGKKLKLGSYIKVHSDKKLITEGYILKHIDGSILILKSRQDASNPDIGGGCKGPAFSIDLDKKQVWGC